MLIELACVNLKSNEKKVGGKKKSVSMYKKKTTKKGLTS